MMGADNVSETLDFVQSLTLLTSRQHFVDPKDCTVSQLGFENLFSPLINPEDGNRSYLRNARFYPISDASEIPTTLCWPKRLHSVTTRKNAIWTSTVVETANSDVHIFPFKARKKIYLGLCVKLLRHRQRIIWHMFLWQCVPACAFRCLRFFFSSPFRSERLELSGFVRGVRRENDYFYDNSTEIWKAQYIRHDFIFSSHFEQKLWMWF